MRNRILAFLEGIMPKGTEINLTVPESDKFGHYSTNVAFSLSKKQGKNPSLIAEEIAGKAEKTGFFSRVEAVGGFVNFWLKDEVLREELGGILKKKDKYGKVTLRQAQGKKVQVEFVSANPTGPLTLANGRGGFLGDVLSNVFEAAGNKVEREYYVNDTGNQIITLGKSLTVALGFNPGLNLGQPANEDSLYKGEYVKEWASKHKSLVKKHQNNPLKLGQFAAKDFLKSIKDTLEKGGVAFGRFTSEEGHIHKKGFADKALKIFKNKKLVYEKDGATWLRTTKFGDDKDRVLITSDGFPTYFLADAGHYLETKSRGFPGKIIILGPDHYGYVKRIQAAAQIVGLEKSEIIVTQAIRLVENGEEVKMSKRAGEFVTFQDLVDEVGADAARFFFLMVTPDTHMDFDLALAKERSVKNPVYYVQYAYVRAVSILKKIKNQKSKIKMTNENLKLLNTETDLSLMRKLIQFPEVIEDTAKDYQVHRLTRYATDLARAFHNFYEKERVIGEERNLAAARLALVRASATVLKNLLDVLGISAPKKM